MNQIFKIILVCCLSFAVNAKENLFSGTWELISGEYINHEGKLVNYEKLNLHSLKVISETHFSFVTMSGDKFWSSGSGTYTYNSVEYIETPLYTSYNFPKGKQYVFKYKLEGETWFSSRWENEKRVEYEVWKRVRYLE